MVFLRKHANCKDGIGSTSAFDKVALIGIDFYNVR